MKAVCPKARRKRCFFPYVRGSRNAVMCGTPCSPGPAMLPCSVPEQQQQRSQFFLHFFSVYNEVEEAVFQQKFAALKTLG